MLCLVRRGKSLLKRKLIFVFYKIWLAYDTFFSVHRFGVENTVSRVGEIPAELGK